MCICLSRWVNSVTIPYILNRDKFISLCCPYNPPDISKYLKKKQFIYYTSVRKDEKNIRALLKIEYELNFPEINAPALWLRFIRIMGLPDHIYSDTYSLSHLTAKTNWKKFKVSESHVLLIALVIIAVKLRYGFIKDDGYIYIAIHLKDHFINFLNRIYDISIKVRQEYLFQFTHVEIDQK